MIARAAEDRLADHRRADHLVVEHDGEGLADILARRVGEAPRAGRIEVEADDRRAVLSKRRLRVGQRVAAHHDALLHDDSCVRPPERPSCSSAAPRRPAAAGRARASSADAFGSTSWKRHLRGLADQTALTCSGSSTPGSWTRMRSSPSRWIVGSLVPVSSMRRRTISIDCSTAELRARSSATVVGLQRDRRRRRRSCTSMLGIDLADDGADIVRCALGLAQREARHGRPRRRARYSRSCARAELGAQLVDERC